MWLGTFFEETNKSKIFLRLSYLYLNCFLSSCSIWYWLKMSQRIDFQSCLILYINQWHIVEAVQARPSYLLVFLILSRHVCKVKNTETISIAKWSWNLYKAPILHQGVICIEFNHIAVFNSELNVYNWKELILPRFLFQ